MTVPLPVLHHILCYAADCVSKHCPAGGSVNVQCYAANACTLPLAGSSAATTCHGGIAQQSSTYRSGTRSEAHRGSMTSADAAAVAQLLASFLRSSGLADFLHIEHAGEARTPDDTGVLCCASADLCNGDAKELTSTFCGTLSQQAAQAKCVAEPVPGSSGCASPSSSKQCQLQSCSEPARLGRAGEGQVVDLNASLPSGMQMRIMLAPQRDSLHNSGA